MISERVEEIKKVTSPTNTSCSMITSNSMGTDEGKIFHLLVDVGHGVVKSLQNIPKSGLVPVNSSYLPNAILITHSHDDHVQDLGTLLNLYDNSR
jgi:ribonuclease BN (tRNA processing enzyme)